MKPTKKKIYIEKNITFRDIKVIGIIVLFICGLALIYFAISPPEVIQERFNENFHQSLLLIVIPPPPDTNMKFMDQYRDVNARQGKCIPLTLQFIKDNEAGGWEIACINKIDPRNQLVVPHMVTQRENVVCDLVWGGCFLKKEYYTMLVRDPPVIFMPKVIYIPDPEMVNV